MKKKIIISVIIMILFLTIKSNAFTIQMSTDKNEIKTGDEVIYTINLDENVVAANFDINYNSSSLELIGSSTNGLDITSKNGKIAYFHYNYYCNSSNNSSYFQNQIKENEKYITITNRNCYVRNFDIQCSSSYK